MHCNQHAGLSQDEIQELFNREFNKEFNAVAMVIRNNAKGTNSYTNTWREWWALGGISVGVILTNAIFSLLSAFGLIPGFVTTIVGVTISVAGVVAAIALQRHRNRNNRAIYQNAEIYIEHELNDENLERLRVKLFRELSPMLECGSPAQIHFLVKTAMAALANIVLNKKFKSFSELESTDFRVLMMDVIHQPIKFAMNTRQIQEMMCGLAANRSQHDVVECVPQAKRSVVGVTHADCNCGAALWSRSESESAYQGEIAQDFANNTVNLR